MILIIYMADKEGFLSGFSMKYCRPPKNKNKIVKKKKK